MQGRRQVKICWVDEHGECGAPVYNWGLEAEPTGPIPLPCKTRSSATAEGPRDASCQLKSCQLPRNSAETTYTTSPDQIDGMKLEI